MVDRLTRGPASVSELARPLAMSLPAVVQHLHVLEASGLVRSQQAGARAHLRRRARRAARRRAVDHRPAHGLGGAPRPARRVPRRDPEEPADQPRQGSTDDERQASRRRAVDHTLDVRDRAHLRRARRSACSTRGRTRLPRRQWFGPRRQARATRSSSASAAASTSSVPGARRRALHLRRRLPGHRPGRADRPHLRHAPRRRAHLGVGGDGRAAGGRRGHAA